MNFLKIEVGPQYFIMQAAEIEKLVSVHDSLASAIEAGRAPRSLIIDIMPLRFYDLKQILLGVPTSLFRGSRLLIPRANTHSIILCELVTGLVNLRGPLTDTMVIEDLPYETLSTADILERGGEHVRA